MADDKRVTVSVSSDDLSDQAKARVEQALKDAIENELDAGGMADVVHNRVVQTFSRSSG